MKGMTGKWSKYGGATGNIIQADIEDVWFCQSCGEKQPKDLSPYLRQLDDDYVLRVCSKCIHNGCVQYYSRVIIRFSEG
jgi:hypothetical protein